MNRILTAALMTLLLGPPARAKLWTYVIGGKEDPWDKVGYAPGGVIDFKKEPGWIWVKQVDPNENIALGTYERRGSVESPNTADLRTSDYERAMHSLVDGKYGKGDNAFERKPRPGRSFLSPLGTLVQIDLGARFGINRIRFFPREGFEEFALKSFDISINDGSPENMIEGRPIYRIIKRVDNWDDIVPDSLKDRSWDVQISIPLQYVRFIQIRSLSTRPWELAEVEVYGSGYVPEAAYESEVIDVQKLTGSELAIWGKIWWSQKKEGDPTKSRILVRTRSGTDPTPMVYYRVLEPGEEDTLRITRREYFQLEPEKRGPIIYRGQDIAEEVFLDMEEKDPEEARKVRFYRRMVSGEEVPFDKNHRPLTKEAWEKLKIDYRGTPRPDYEHWSPWSEPYDYEKVVKEGGVPILSPAPRRYFQIRIDFLSTSLDAAGAVGSLGITFSVPPVAHRLVGEIAVLDHRTGRPSFTARAGVPERFLYSVLAESRGMDAGFDQLKILTATEIDTVEAVIVDGDTLSGDKWDYTVAPDSFVVRFPRVRKDGALVQVVFRGTVLRYGTMFQGWASVRGSGDIPQKVEPGDATPDVPTNSLSVRTELGRGFVVSLRADPEVFTPNGDGVNETSNISYNLLQVTRPVPVSARIYTLSGEVVRTLVDGKQESKVYNLIWDGKDEDGNLAEPGLYLVVVEVHTDSGVERKMRTVSVVY